MSATEPKRILLLDVPAVTGHLPETLERFGYQVFALNQDDFIEEAITRNAIHLAIFPVEMHLPQQRGDAVLKTDSLSPDRRYSRFNGRVLDSEYGYELMLRIRQSNIRIPVIYLTTQDHEEPVLYYIDDPPRLHAATISKISSRFTQDLKHAIAQCLIAAYPE